ncbi:glycosyltransferase family 4 protein [Rhodococcus sp. BS-15]|uniref:glycosyltransferase family 4 protein n=1 Tax=Rhodococcus sp. BS-15 TaxID=1304954 RepID=UPI000FFB25C2|nr:glycosyltransferase family 4 protein [Rhodococcus sp. BS-15]
MRILVLHNDYQQAGGETMSVQAEIASLQARGHDVNILQISNDTLNSMTRKEALERVLRPKFSFDLVNDALQKNSPEIVHAQNLFPLLGAGAINALYSNRIPWVRSLRNFRKRCLSANLFREGETCTICKTSRTALKGIAKGCYRDSKAQSAVALAYARQEYAAERRYPPKAYVAVSELVAHEVQESLVPGIPLVIKPNAVRNNASPSKTSRSGVLFVGRLEGHKGIDIAVAMARAMPDVSFTFVGDGPESGVVGAAELSGQNITWFRRLQNTKVLELMAASQLVIAPSRWMEPFGRVAVESMSVGTIPLVGNVGGMREIVEKFDKSLALPVDNVYDWISKSRCILSMDESEYRLHSASCFSAYQEHYTVRTNGVLLEEIFEKYAVGND